MKRTGAGFTILEVAIVVVLMSICLSCVVLGRVYLRNAKINTIMSDISSYKKAISMFYSSNECLPGNCGWSFTKKLNYQQNEFGCTSSVVANKNGFFIDQSNPNSAGNIYKTICAWMELQAAGFIKETVSTANNSSDSFFNSINPVPFGIGGYHVPILAGTKDTSLFLATLFSKNLRFAPAALSFDEIYPDYSDRHYIITSFVEKASSATPNGNSAALIAGAMPYFNNDNQSFGTNSLNSSILYELDSKYDDGLPYSGKIFADRDGALRADGSDVDSGCVKLSAARDRANTKPSDGLYRNDTSKCNVAFLIDTLL